MDPAVSHHRHRQELRGLLAPLQRLPVPEELHEPRLLPEPAGGGLHALRGLRGQAAGAVRLPAHAGRGGPVLAQDPLLLPALLPHLGLRARGHEDQERAAGLAASARRLRPLPDGAEPDVRQAGPQQRHRRHVHPQADPGASCPRPHAPLRQSRRLRGKPAAMTPVSATSHGELAAVTSDAMISRKTCCCDVILGDFSRKTCSSDIRRSI